MGDEMSPQVTGSPSIYDFGRAIQTMICNRQCVVHRKFAGCCSNPFSIIVQAEVNMLVHHGVVRVS